MNSMTVKTVEFIERLAGECVEAAVERWSAVAHRQPVRFREVASRNDCP